MTDRKHTTQDQRRAARGSRAQEKAAQAAAQDAAQAAEAQDAEQAAEVAAQVTEPQAGDAGASDELAELAAVTRERDEYLDHLRRLKAEFENYRKRVQRDHEELRLRAAETVVESLLPVMDNMGRALEAAERHEEGQLLAGLELVAGQLRGTLEGHGLEETPVEPGVLFDPTVHEAIMAQPSPDHPEGTVTQVLERGYLLHGRLLRPAKVIVAS